jgi:hypothetical protein
LRAQPVLIVWALLGLVILLTYLVPAIWVLQVRLEHGVWYRDLHDRDFVNYWVGSVLALDGREAVLFDQRQYYPLLKALFGPDFQIHAWSYPPHFLLMVAPLGLLPYLAALTSFLLATLALFIYGAHSFRKSLAPSASPGLTAMALVAFAVTMVATTQNGFLTAGLTLLALANMYSRPAIAGLALACLTVKPQLGILFPLLVLLDRNWRLLGWTAAFTALWVAASTFFFGTESWRAFFLQVLPYQNFVMHGWEGLFLRMMPSLFGSLRTLGIDPALALKVHLVFAVLAFASVAWLLVRLRDPLARAFVLLGGTLLVTPYSFNYDMGAFAVVGALLAQSPVIHAKRAKATLVGFMAVLPAIVTQLGLSGYPLAPLLIAGALAVVAVEYLRAERPVTATGLTTPG